MGDTIADSIRNAFLKVKEDIILIKEQISENQHKIDGQETKMKGLIKHLEAISREINEAKVKSSIGNDGADQSINQSINQSPINQSITPKTVKKVEFGRNKELEGANQSINQSITNQSPEMQIKPIADNINRVFLTLTKQELKIFLTIYQLEDEGIEPSYKNISLKMQLSEHCVRGHMSSLLKKNSPLTKAKLNNKTSILSVHKDFRALGLKQRLINLYYESDPNQKTLFDV